MSVAVSKPASPASGASANLYMVFMFLLCFAFSYVDRQIISVLVPPIKSALLLSDLQIGLLQGAAFTLCYATAGIFVAQLVDRSNRVILAASCVAIWAMCTVLSGLATNFTELLLARAGTAIAEAALSPAALSIFSDIYPPRKVARATSAFMLGPFIGGGVALMGGGWLLGTLEQPAHHAWLASTGLQAWQMVFVAVGAPGLVLAAVVGFTLREPARRGDTGPAAAGGAEEVPGFRAVLTELFVRNRFVAPYFAGYVALITTFYAHAAWFPTMLMRRFGLDAASVGQMAGPAYMLGGACGVLSAAYLVGKVADEHALKKVLRIATRAACCLVPLAIAAPLTGSLPLAVVLYGGCAFAASIIMGLAPVPLQIAIPNRMRGRAVALLVFLTNLISGSVGPFAVGAIADRLPYPLGLSHAIVVVGTVAALFSATMYAVSARWAPAAQRQR